MDRSKDMENSNGLMALIMREILKIIILRDMVTIIGQILETMMALGRQIRCMVTAYSRGLMEEFTKENMLTTKNKVMGFSYGLEAKSIMDNGLMENSMVKVFIDRQRDR